MMDENNLSTDAHYLRAMYRYKMGMYKESFDDAEFVITRKSSNEEQTKVLIAKIFMACKQWDNAEAMCLEILTQNQQRIDVITLLADIYCFKNDYAKAEELLKKAMEIQSNYYGIYKVYARLELQRNQLGNANYLLNYLQEINSDAELFVIRSMFFDRVNQPDAAVKMIDEALKIEPHYFEAVEIKKRKDNAKKAMQPSQVTNSAFSF
jgi:tetratricopeptide (TPR) repeat protein